MHISLDSALGRQRRLNSVGESVLQIAPNAAAAYSLRSLTGGDPKVVRVRRASDNGERDFTSSEITSGEMVNWVNRQVIAPLDIQALEADGRTGDFLIAKAAYALRSLGTRQATITSVDSFPAPFTSVTGKFVVQVRRSSDDTFKSFTADEVTDGTLLAFVGTGGSDNGFVKIWYDQSVTTQAGDTATGNHAVQATAASQPKIVSAGALNTSGGLEFDGSDDFFSLTSNISFENKAGCVFSLQDGQDSSNDFTLGRTDNNRGIGFRNIQTRWFYTTGAIDIDNSSPPSGLALFTALHDGTTNDPNVTAFVNSSLIVDGSPDANQGEVNVSTTANQIGARRALSFLEGTVKEIVIYDTNQTDNRGAIEANIGEAYSITGIPAYDNEVDGFVETWYDQSGNSKDAVQATAGSQPKIVNAGSLVTSSGLASIKFDGTDDTLTADSLASVFSGTDKVWSHFSVTEFNNVDNGPIVANLGSSSTNSPIIYSGLSTTPKYRLFVRDDADTNVLLESGTLSLNTPYLNHATTNGAAQTQFVNSNAAGTGSTNTGAMTFNQFTLGAFRRISTASFYNGSISEFIIHNTDQSSNRVAIETNINSHYSIF